MKGKFCFENAWAREGYFGENVAKIAAITGPQGPGARHPVSPCRVKAQGAGEMGASDPRFGPDLRPLNSRPAPLPARLAAPLAAGGGWSRGFESTGAASLSKPHKRSRLPDHKMLHGLSHRAEPGMADLGRFCGKRLSNSRLLSWR